MRFDNNLVFSNIKYKSLKNCLWFQENKEIEAIIPKKRYEYIE